MSGKHEKKEKISNTRKNKINNLKIVFLVIAVIFIIVTIGIYSAVVKTNMIPAKYIIIFTIFEVILTLALVLGLIKKHKTLKLNIICLIIMLIISVGYTFATHYIDITMKFLGNFFTEISEVEQYYIIVHKDSAYNNIEDIKNKEIYSFQLETDIEEKLKGKINATINTSDNLIALGESLLNKEIDIIVVSASQYNILIEENKDFKDNTKIILTETHQIQTQATIEDSNTKYNIENGIFNIYVSGIDTYGNINNVSRSDANIIITINTNTHKILLTSIPRDYYVTLHSKKAKDKLTHSGIYGITETVTTVEDLLGIDINYYIRVNFTTLIKLIDILGGVDVYSDYSFTSNGYSYQKGYNHLNGSSALIFSRERHSFATGDNQRIKNQQKVIEAVINKTLNSTTILTKYTSLLNSLSGSFNTNIKQNEISNIVKKQLESMPKWEIKNISLSGTGATSTTYSTGSQLLYVMIPNQKSVDEAKNAIESIINS